MGTGADARGLARSAIGLAAVAALLLVGCADRTPPSAPAATEPPLGYQRVLGPDFPAMPPPDAGPRIDAAWLPRDRRSLFVSFLGGPIYAVDDPCSEDYTGWAGIAADRLDVAIARVRHPEQRPFVQQPGQPVMACPAVGYGYLFELRLAVPFLGSEVRGAGSGPLWVAPPDRVVELDRLPDGYALAMVGAEPTTHELSREYRTNLTGRGGDDRYLYLSQVFGGPTSHPIDAAGTIAIHGVDVPFGKNGDAGFIVNWPLGRDTLTLISYDPDLTLEAFTAMANAVAIPIR